MENELICHQIIVTGKVQGVWFRDSTLKKAHELGVKGFVKNQPDGSVYIEAEGTPSAIKEFCPLPDYSVRRYDSLVDWRQLPFRAARTWFSQVAQRSPG